MPPVVLDHLDDFVTAWIPLFIAMDPVGMIPIFLGLTEDVERPERNRVANMATITAAVVGLAFIVAGEVVFQALGITMADFQIAGGLVLLILGIQELIHTRTVQRPSQPDMGVVPLGTPLIAGPATLVALLMLVKSIGLPITLAAFFANLILVWAGFRWCDAIVRAIGIRGLRVLSKIVALILTAYAVSIIRRGVETVFFNRA